MTVSSTAIAAGLADLCPPDVEEPVKDLIELCGAAGKGRHCLSRGGSVGEAQRQKAVCSVPSCPPVSSKNLDSASFVTPLLGSAICSAERAAMSVRGWC